MGVNLNEIFENPNINSRIFYPRKIKRPISSIENIEFLDLRINPTTTIGAVFYHQKKNLPTIILFHGNGEIATDYSYGIENFFEMGVNLMVIDFRGYGFSTGSPSYNFLINDAVPSFELAIEWLNLNGFSQNRLLMGRSLGSVCAAEIASHNPSSLDGVIFESGFADTLELMKSLFMINLPGIDQTIIAPWSNLPRIKKILLPTLIIHGTKDNIVPFFQGLLIQNTLPESTPKQFISIEGAGHNDIQLFREPYFNALKEFVQEKVKKTE